MKLDRKRVYIFMLRRPDGTEGIGVRRWNGRSWATRRLESAEGYGPWEIRLSRRALWRNGPRMVLEVPA